MTPIIYPSIMGLFCTGYVLHLAWRAWERRRARRFIHRWDIEFVANEVFWLEHSLSPQGSETP